MPETCADKVVVSILSEDRPGIVYGVTKALAEQACRLLEVSQTRLQSEFAAIFIASIPQGQTVQGLKEALDRDLEHLNLTVGVKPFKPAPHPWSMDAEPLVITLRGRDRLDLISGFTGVIYGFDVNIEQLKAIPHVDDADHVIIAFEVSVPRGVHQPAFREALRIKAEELGMDVSIQHRDIFEAIHRI